MGASDGLKIGAGLLITVLIVSIMFSIYKSGANMTNKGLSQAADLTANANDIDKQKYEGMTITGDQVMQVISDYWEDSTCEIVVCTLDGVNAVYNKESTDGTYTVPFNEALTGMPSADCKGRAFANDATVSKIPDTELNSTTVENDNLGDDKKTYDVAKAAKLTGNAIIIDAARLVQNPTGTTHTILATPNGYNTGATMGSGGYISTTSNFLGSIQKDANGTIRRITFVQKG